jgi:hypothetical protein
MRVLKAYAEKDAKDVDPKPYLVDHAAVERRREKLTKAKQEKLEKQRKAKVGSTGICRIQEMRERGV